MYFNATMLNRLNPQLFAGSNPLIDVTTDAHGDVYYANHLLSLFLMNESGSSLSNFYYKVPVPKHQEDEFMGIHRQRGMISERDSTLFSVLLIASAVLEIASIVMVVVVIAHLIKHNEKSIGVLKANGLNGFKIAFAISICFMLVLVFTGLLAVIFSALIGYILNLTYSGFTQMTSYSFIFIWYVAVVDFFLPIVLIIPFVAIFALLMIRKSPLVLIKGVSDKRITLISFKYHFDPFKYISKIHISFKHKLSFKFAFSARGKLFLTIVITLISTIGLYIVLNLMQTNTNMVGGVNDQFVASNIYGYGKQNLENQDGSIAKKDALNYYFYNESSIKGLLQGDLKAQVTPSGWPLYHHAMINDANGNVHFINQIRTSDFTSGIKTSLPIANIKNCWILASDLQSWSKSQGWNLLPQSIKNIYDANSDQISVLAQNQGIITVGFEVYNSHHDGLLLNANADVYQLLNNDAKNILLFNNNGKNSGWIDNEIVQKLLNQKELLKAKGTQIIAPSKYSESKTKIRLHSEHYDMNQFLTANIDDSNFDKNGKIDLSSQIALAHNDSRIIESLKKIKEQLIDQWIAMGIRHFNVIPIMVNSYFKVSGISQIGDILFSNQTNNNGLNVYVIYDWLDTLNAGFMVAPYSAAYQNIYKTKPIANQLVYNWKLASNPTIELNYQISLVSADNNYGITTLEPPDLKVNLNSMIMKEMMLQSIHDANSSLVMVIQSIGVLTVILTIVQVTVTMNIILKSNINTINLLKAFGYNKFWIFNRLFMIYIPLIILSGILAFPFGYLVSYFTYQVVIRASHIFTPFTVNLPTIFIIIVVMLVLFAIILIIVMWYNNHHYPVHKFIG